MIDVVGWVALGVVTVLAATLLARRVLHTPPGRRRWLALDGALLALVAPVEIAVWALSGGGLFWPAFSIPGFTLLFGLHAWWVARQPDETERVLVGRVTSLTRTRREALDAQADELRRIERDLHDGTQARLVSLALNLGLAESLVRQDPDAALELLAETRQAAGAALDDLRAVMHGIRPGVLFDRGLVEGVRALAVDLAVPTTITGELVQRLSPAAELTTYFAVAEGLANVVKHSGAASACVHFVEEADQLVVTVDDDGHGGADPSAGTGLQGVAARLAPFDGTLEVESPAGGPTHLVVRVPLS